jgi:hypothetical protein
MKLSLALGPRQPLSRQMAWGCLTTNLTLPGFGSLLAGRKVGYFQIPFTFAGFGLTTIFGIPTLIWFARNYTRLQSEQDDPFQNLAEMWPHLRWPLLGMAIFAFVILWSLTTSLGIVAEARAAERKAKLLRPLPPKIKRDA